METVKRFGENGNGRHGSSRGVSLSQLCVGERDDCHDVDVDGGKSERIDAVSRDVMLARSGCGSRIMLPSDVWDDEDGGRFGV